MEEALELFRKGVRLLPHSAEPRLWLGRTLLKLGRTAEGEQELRRVGEMQSKNLEAERERLKPSIKTLPDP
ncbi:MAG: hypothetical protein DMG08_13650 [Acidobacteria bacterium]|nr:MAG: hypothetical protein DMG08_13650 [Acidobacteriota bacterium]